MSIRLAWRPNRQEKNPWQLAAKYIDFPCHSILGGLCLVAGRQEHLPWRFTYIPWRISTAKVNLVSGSERTTRSLRLSSLIDLIINHLCDRLIFFKIKEINSGLCSNAHSLKPLRDHTQPNLSQQLKIIKTLVHEDICTKDLLHPKK